MLCIALVATIAKKIGVFDLYIYIHIYNVYYFISNTKGCPLLKLNILTLSKFLLRYVGCRGCHLFTVPYHTVPSNVNRNTSAWCDTV